MNARLLLTLPLLGLLGSTACKGDAPAPTADPRPAAADPKATDAVLPAPGTMDPLLTPTPAEPARPAAPQAPVEPKAGVKVTLLDAGAEPRVALSIATAAGQVERAQAAVRLEEHMFLGGRLPSAGPATSALGRSPPGGHQ